MITVNDSPLMLQIMLGVVVTISICAVYCSLGRLSRTKKAAVMEGQN